MTHILEIGFFNKVFCLCFRNFKFQILQFIIKFIKDFVLFEKLVVYLCYYMQIFCHGHLYVVKNVFNSLLVIFFIFKHGMYQVALRDLYFWEKLLFFERQQGLCQRPCVKIILYVVFKTLNQMEKKNFSQNNTNVPKNEHMFFAQVDPLVMFIYFLKHCS